jgi:hypothetical protein
MAFRNKYGEYDSMTSSGLSIIGVFALTLGLMGYNLFIVGIGVVLIVLAFDIDRRKRRNEYQDEIL